MVYEDSCTSAKGWIDAQKASLENRGLTPSNDAPLQKSQLGGYQLDWSERQNSLSRLYAFNPSQGKCAIVKAVVGASRVGWSNLRKVNETLSMLVRTMSYID
jgi:hypothetical protein